ETEEVRQLSVDRPADRGREDVRRKRPRVDVVAAKVGHDPRERGPDDGLIERREEQSKEDRGDDLRTGPRIHANGHSGSDGLRHSGRTPIKWGLVIEQHQGPKDSFPRMQCVFPNGTGGSGARTRYPIGSCVPMLRAANAICISTWRICSSTTSEPWPASKRYSSNFL